MSFHNLLSATDLYQNAKKGQPTRASASCLAFRSLFGFPPLRSFRILPKPNRSSLPLGMRIRLEDGILGTGKLNGQDGEGVGLEGKVGWPKWFGADSSPSIDNSILRDQDPTGWQGWLSRRAFSGAAGGGGGQHVLLAGGREKLLPWKAGVERSRRQLSSAIEAVRLYTRVCYHETGGLGR